MAHHAGLRHAYRRSDLVELLRTKLFAPEYSIRGNSISTLGRLGPRENAHHLRAALPWYMEHDPLRLDALIFELGWLVRRRRLDHRQLLGELAKSQSYLTRWVTVSILWSRELSRGRLEWGARRSPGWAVQLLRRLAQDAHPSVRSEARGVLGERRQRRLEGPRPRRGVANEILDPEPSYFDLRIETLEIQVGNYLHSSGEADYDVDLVETIARHTDLHPITPGYDPKSYWAPVTGARHAATAAGS